MKFLVLVLPILWLQACDFSGHANVSVVSGSIDNSYVAEPLDDLEEKYSIILDSSNGITKLIENSNTKRLYDDYFEEVLKDKVPFKRFSNLISDISGKVGPITEYKDLQWAFFPVTENEVDIVQSVKIVKHGERFFAYKYSFIRDGNHRKIIGISVSPMKNSRLIGS